MTKFVYSFGARDTEGDGSMKETLGGKGAGLAEMARIGIPVPPGYTITTAACIHFAKTGEVPREVAAQEAQALARLEEETGKRFGDPADPLLVSVRSGAKFSMPGMMDTILNLGLNDATAEALAARSRDERFAYDTYRRLLQMFGDVVLSIPHDLFEGRLKALREAKGAASDLDLDAGDMKTLAGAFLSIIRDHHAEGFPQEPRRQLSLARDAVFKSWNNDRAVYYRRQNGIPDELGTAVNVQTMVFGNQGGVSGTGVGFTRNPATGRKELYGEYLMNAQGEDVVAGVRTPHAIADLAERSPELFGQISDLGALLERHFRDMQDFEFTFERGTLYILQTRAGKRTGAAAVKVAVDLVEEGLIDVDEALLRVAPLQLDQLLHPRIDPDSPAEVIAKGLGASPGAAVGKLVFDPDDAVLWSARKEKVLLVRNDTSPDDIHGMDAAQGILTATGGMTSHAAVVARGMGKPCVAGCSALEIHEEEGWLAVGGKTYRRGDVLAINGTTGEVLSGEVRTLEPEVGDEFRTLLAWADGRRRLGVRTNADTPKDAAQARAFGAEGIGLCRTEHMFFAEERLPWVQKMILSAGEEAGGASAFKEALDRLLPFQREDFKGILRAMDGCPVTIRLLDPPLHEFLPRREDLMVEVALLKARGDADPQDKERVLRRVEELHEWNPMMGHRGCRLGITYPDITAMQTRAIMEAASALVKEGIDVRPEIMIPLVGSAEELKNQRDVVERVVETVREETGARVDVLVGTMIEVPRAALTAGDVARHADFFSFGTNDLTQMTFGFSRDDAGKFLGPYIELGILAEDPFVSLDVAGVGQLVEMAAAKGRAARPGLKVGICGEHGGEPRSIAFCHGIGLDYVSCSPYRVPIARLAAAQARIQEERARRRAS